MSQGELLIALASAGAVALMSLLAYLLGFRARGRIADEAALRALIAEAEPGVRISRALVDERGRAGLAELADGRWAAAASVADSVVVRIFAHARIGETGARVRARFGDAGFPDITLRIAGGAR
jgi:hypothetical protein